MRYALGFLLFAAITVEAGWLVASWSGMVDLSVGDDHLQASLPVFALIATVLFLCLYGVVRLIGLLVSMPRRIGHSRAGWQKRQGDKAATHALIALAGGDALDARAQAIKARYWLGDTPQTLLLVAQAEHLAGHHVAAEEALRCLATRTDVGHVGLRGLLRQAIARRDWAQADALVVQAGHTYHNAVWLRQEQAQIAMQNGEWRAALQLGGTPMTDAPFGPALAAAASFAAVDPAESLRLSKQAFKADPSLVPAALQYARGLRAAGAVRRSLAVLRRAYAASPNPAIAQAYLADIDSALIRVQAAETLVAKQANHHESQLLLARLSLEAGLIGEARRYAGLLRNAGFDQRRLWVLVADIAAAHDAGTASDAVGDDAISPEQALRRALTASPDPTWQCSGCGTQAPDWQPVCGRCHRPGLAVWAAHAVMPRSE